MSKALEDKKKSCLLPGGLPLKVLNCIINDCLLKERNQSFEYISVRDAKEDIYTPLLENQVLVFYNNVEVKDPMGEDERSDLYC